MPLIQTRVSPVPQVSGNGAGATLPPGEETTTSHLHLLQFGKLYPACNHVCLIDNVFNENTGDQARTANPQWIAYEASSDLLVP